MRPFILSDPERTFLEEFFSPSTPKSTIRERLWDRFEKYFKQPGRTEPQDNPELKPFADFRSRAIDLNYRYIGLYRGTFLLNYLLAVVAVILAVFSLILLVNSDHPPILWLLILRLAKLAVVVSIFRNTHAANHGDWNEMAIDYRYLAERLRAMSYLPRLGSFRSPAPNSPQYASRVQRQRVVDWLFQAIVRHAPPVDDAKLLRPAVAGALKGDPSGASG